MKQTRQKEYKTRHDWVGRVIQWKMHKKHKSDHTNKWYIHNPESVLESEIQTILWNFEIRTDKLIPDRRLDQVLIIKKKNLSFSGLCHPNRQ